MNPKIKIVFDFTCPYCYLAWGYLRKLQQDYSFEVEWMSWEIQPNMPPTGIRLSDFLSPESLVETQNSLNELGEPVALRPGDKTFSSNTRWALEALEFAKEYHKEQEWVDAVYQSSFVQRQDIGDLHTLLDIAKSLELDTDKLRSALENHVYYRVLLRNDQYCMEQRLEFVPTIYSGDKILLEGVLTFDMVQDKIRMLAKK